MDVLSVVMMLKEMPCGHRWFRPETCRVCRKLEREMEDEE